MTDEHAELTDERAEETFRELQNELAISPSPEFAAKVRARVAAAPARGWFGGLRLMPAAVAMVTLAGVVAGGVMWRHVGRPSDPGGQAPSAPTDSSATMAAAGGAGTGVGSVATAVPMIARPPVSRASAPAGRRVSIHDMQVLVPPDQAIAVRQYLAALRAGRDAGIPAGVPIFDETTGELLTPAPIVIPLITIEPLPGGPDDRSGGRQKR